MTITVDKAADIIERETREALGGEIDDVAARAAALAAGLHELRIVRRGLEATMREQGLSDFEVLVVNDRVYGRFDEAMKTLAKAIS